MHWIWQSLGWMPIEIATGKGKESFWTWSFAILKKLTIESRFCVSQHSKSLISLAWDLVYLKSVCNRSFAQSLKYSRCRITTKRLVHQVCRSQAVIMREWLIKAFSQLSKKKFLRASIPWANHPVISVFWQSEMQEDKVHSASRRDWHQVWVKQRAQAFLRKQS